MRTVADTRRMDSDRDLVLAELLDVVLEHDLVLVDLVAGVRERIGDVTVGDRPEQRVLFVGLGRNVDLDALELGRLGARLLEHLVVAQLALALELLVEVGGLGAGGNREAPRQQVIAGIARLDVDEGALVADAFETLEQDHIHRTIHPFIAGPVQEPTRAAEIQPDVAQPQRRGDQHEHRHGQREHEQQGQSDDRWGHPASEHPGFYDRDSLDTKPQTRVEQQRPSRRRPRRPLREQQREARDQKPQRPVRETPVRKPRSRQRGPGPQPREARRQRASGRDQHGDPDEQRRRQHVGQDLPPHLGLFLERQAKRVESFGLISNLTPQIEQLGVARA